jgi:hypothetical protein
MINLTTHVAGFNRNHPFYLVIDRFKTPKATAGYGCNAISSLRWRYGVSHRANL